jgi:hypothetical protein
MMSEESYSNSIAAGELPAGEMRTDMMDDLGLHGYYFRPAVYSIVMSQEDGNYYCTSP